MLIYGTETALTYVLYYWTKDYSTMRFILKKELVKGYWDYLHIIKTPT